MSLLNPAEDPLAILRDSTRSSEREQLVEYGLIYELLRDGWLRRKQRIEVLRPDVDCAGYDLMLHCHGVTRHVQLKSSLEGGTTVKQKVHIALAGCPSGCVVWVVLSAGGVGALKSEYLVYGASPGQPLPSLAGFKLAKHSKGNAQGIKAVRPDIRVVPKAAFARMDATSRLSDWLFGPPPV